MTEIVGQSVCCSAKLVNVDTGVVGMVLTCSACGLPTERKEDSRAEKKRAYNEAFQRRKKRAKKKTAAELLHDEALEAEEVQRRLKREFLAGGS